jgi:hypothetical protein
MVNSGPREWVSVSAAWRVVWNAVTIAALGRVPKIVYDPAGD